MARHAPFARGVSQLMYVGDTEAVDKATSSTTSKITGGDLAALGVLGFVYLNAKGLVRTAAVAAAAYGGYRILTR